MCCFPKVDVNFRFYFLDMLEEEISYLVIFVIFIYLIGWTHIMVYPVKYPTMFIVITMSTGPLAQDQLNFVQTTKFVSFYLELYKNKLELWVTSLSDTPHLQYYDVQTLEYRYISKLPMKNEQIWSYVKETTTHLQNKLTKNICR
jgi:hypothetical protein